MSEDEIGSKTLLKLIDVMQKQLGELQDQMNSVIKAINDHADILQTMMAQQKRTAGVYEDVQSMKKVLGTVVAAAKAVFETQTLREAGERIAERAKEQ